MEPMHTQESRRSRGYLYAFVWSVLLLMCVYLGVMIYSAFVLFTQVLVCFAGPAIVQTCDAMNEVWLFQAILQNGDSETAYSFTTREFQRRQTLEEFSDFVAAHPVLLCDCTISPAEVPSGNCCLFTFTTEADKRRKVTGKVRIRKEEGKWKVDEIVLSED